ncbi:hypothetical protein JCM19237_5601 [Photobacterium aphoticum]|uniref:Uncharacterized protein n=1 Tax=Photobacterium aphoticum TaxID=754436 RepID=A0A090QKC2_9GAMM|nr:hypothetical protein JCM19237_5601 [Photobacterium aphoticum]
MGVLKMLQGLYPILSKGDFRGNDDGKALAICLRANAESSQIKMAVDMDSLTVCVA